MSRVAIGSRAELIAALRAQEAPLAAAKVVARAASAAPLPLCLSAPLPLSALCPSASLPLVPRSANLCPRRAPPRAAPACRSI